MFGKFIKFFSKNKQEIRKVYAINHGTYIGQLWVCIDIDSKNNREFLVFPKYELKNVVSKDFDDALNKDIIAYLETIPQKEFDNFKKTVKFLKTSKK